MPPADPRSSVAVARKNSFWNLPSRVSTWMRFPFLLADGIDRTAFQETLLARGVPTRMIWTGNILRQPGFASIDHRAPKDGLRGADRVMDRGLCLPTHQGMSDEDIEQVATALEDTLAEL